MAMNTPKWKSASAEMFAEPLSTPSPFKGRVRTRRTSMYVRNKAVTENSVKGIAVNKTNSKLSKIGKAPAKRAADQVFSPILTRARRGSVYVKGESSLDNADQPKPRGNRRQTLAGHSLRNAPAIAKKSIGKEKTVQTRGINAKPSIKKARSKDSMSSLLSPKSASRARSVQVIVLRTPLKTLNTQKSPKPSPTNTRSTKSPVESETSKDKPQVGGDQTASSHEASDSELNISINKKISSKVFYTNKKQTPKQNTFSQTSSASQLKEGSKKKSSKKSSRKENTKISKTMSTPKLSAAEMKQLLDDSSNRRKSKTGSKGDGSFIENTPNKPRKMSPPQKTNKSAKKTIASRPKTPTRLAKTVGSESNISREVDSSPESLPKAAPIKSKSTPILSPQVKQMKKSIAKTPNSAYVTPKEKLTKRKSVRLAPITPRTPAGKIQRKATPGRSRNQVESSEGDENKVENSNTDGLNKTPKPVLINSSQDEVDNESENVKPLPRKHTPAKALRVLGKVQGESRSIEELPPRTSTPRKSTKKRVAAPPVSEIRSKRIRAVLGEVNTEANESRTTAISSINESEGCVSKMNENESMDVTGNEARDRGVVHRPAHGWWWCNIM